MAETGSATDSRIRSRLAGLRRWMVFLVMRLGLLVLVLFMLSLLTFGITRFTGTPLYVVVGQQATEEMIEARAEAMGLNKPIWEQYATYARNLLQGNLGMSRRTFTPVRGDIGARLPATAELVALSVALGVLWAVPLGALAAIRPRGWADRFGSWLSQIGVSVPSFWLGLLLIFLLYYVVRVFPAPLGRLGGVPPPPHLTGLFTIDALAAGDVRLFVRALHHLALPAITLSFTSSPPIFTTTRAAVDAVLNSKYVEAARSYGLPTRRIFWRHVARAASPPVVNLVAMTFGYLIGGAVLVEVVFSWPGIGLYAVQAMSFSDYDAVLGVVLVTAVIYSFVYFLSDLFQYSIDPRLRE